MLGQRVRGCSAIVWLLVSLLLKHNTWLAAALYCFAVPQVCNVAKMYASTPYEVCILFVHNRYSWHLVRDFYSL